jgi:hypothetical protein
MQEYKLTKADLLEGLYQASDEAVINLLNIVGFGTTTPPGKEEEVERLGAELAELELQIKALESLS